MLGLLVILCVGGGIIGMQLIVTLGISTNTSIIGALVGMVLGRLPLALLSSFRSIHRQNLAQSAISTATFACANALLLPIGLPFVMGMPELILPMFIGVALATLLDGYLLYRMFDSRVFPASAAWPPGVAAAEAIKAGDQGGAKARLLALGVMIGVIGAALPRLGLGVALPMSAVGAAFIGNVWALAMFGIGLLIRGYSSSHLFGPAGWLPIAEFPRGDIYAAYVPQGFMLGAGLVALGQVVMILMNRSKEARALRVTTTDAEVTKVLKLGTVAYIGIAILIALMGGLVSKMSVPLLIAFIVYAALAAYVHEIIVGLAAMHSGWFPAFGVAIMTLVIGLFFGFPPEAMALLVGFAAATGPAFADMGYDLKAGYILRGNGADPAFELEGRKQQFIASLVAYAIAIILVYFSYDIFFKANQYAPINNAYKATIAAGANWDVAVKLMIAAVPGALLQWLGGPTRQLGVLLATGLLISFPIAGWCVLAGLAVRVIWENLRGAEGKSELEVFGGGLIAGDALYAFFNSLFNFYFPVKR